MWGLGPWLLCLTLLLLIMTVFKFGNHWIDNWKEIEVQLLENDRVKASWNYLYFHANKGVQRIMDSAYPQIIP